MRPNRNRLIVNERYWQQRLTAADRYGGAGAIRHIDQHGDPAMVVGLRTRMRAVV